MSHYLSHGNQFGAGDEANLQSVLTLAITRYGIAPSEHTCKAYHGYCGIEAKDDPTNQV